MSVLKLFLYELIVARQHNGLWLIFDGAKIKENSEKLHIKLQFKREIKPKKDETVTNYYQVYLIYQHFLLIFT